MHGGLEGRVPAGGDAAEVMLTDRAATCNDDSRLSRTVYLSTYSYILFASCLSCCRSPGAAVAQYVTLAANPGTLCA